MVDGPRLRWFWWYGWNRGSCGIGWVACMDNFDIGSGSLFSTKWRMWKENFFGWESGISDVGWWWFVFGKVVGGQNFD